MAPMLFALSFWQRLAAVPLAYLFVWCVLVALCVSIVVLMRARWGQSRPLQKCAVLSLLVHLVFGCLAMTVRIVVGDGGGGGISGPPIRVRIVSDTSETVAMRDIAPAEPDVAAPEITAPALLEPRSHDEQPPEAPERTEDPAVAAPLETPSIADAPAEPLESAPPPVIDAIVDEGAPRAETEPNEPTPPAREKSTVADGSSSPVPAATSPSVAAAPAPTPDTGAYALRSAPGRLGLIEMQGGNVQTEAAVTAALQWLAAAQSPDGHWDADRFGAGRELAVLGHDRHGAGRNADTGIAALALLAFLGAGHSHQAGDYQSTVHRGLEFLLRTQATDGNIFGSAEFYAQMYCHSMATFALGEAAAMTSDEQLRPAVSRAVNYSIRAQHPSTGGWRYRPGDMGDTSQLGWQMMALASAERAGMKVPRQTWSGVEQFLQSVRRGKNGGLASYRPDSRASTSMTAEALYCRLLLAERLDNDVDESAMAEATGHLLGSLPDGGRINLYYWYYATLALHHRQQDGNQAAAAWHAWNDALTAVLLSKQVSDGPEAGSWNTDCLWGGYGGRVYTTAMSTMCLEVYYRYAPEPRRNPWVAARPDAHDSSRQQR